MNMFMFVRIAVAALAGTSASYACWTLLWAGGLFPWLLWDIPPLAASALALPAALSGVLFGTGPRRVVRGAVAGGLLGLPVVLLLGPVGVTFGLLPLAAAGAVASWAAPRVVPPRETDGTP